MGKNANKMAGMKMLDAVRKGKYKHHVVDMMLFRLFVRQLDRPLNILKKETIYMDKCLTSNIESNCLFIINLIFVFACLTFFKHYELDFIGENHHG